jgi:hypothetical protein
MLTLRRNILYLLAASEAYQIRNFARDQSVHRKGSLQGARSATDSSLFDVAPHRSLVLCSENSPDLARRKHLRPFHHLSFFTDVRIAIMVTLQMFHLHRARVNVHVNLRDSWLGWTTRILMTAGQFYSIA